jgi:hypothetical protein
MASKGTGSIGGSTTQVQFNNAGVLGGSASLTWSGTVLTSSGFAGPLNGTVGATTPAAGSFTTTTIGTSETLSYGTANGVAYLNGSKVLTSGSALSFDGTNFGLGAAWTTNPLRTAQPQYFQFGASTAGLVIAANGVAFFQAMRFSDNGSGTNLIFSKGRGTYASPTAVASGDAMGTMDFRAYGGTTSRTLSQIIGAVDTYTSDTDISSYLTFGTSPSGSAASTERMRIDSSGNLGIGTTSPSNTLTVGGSNPQIQISGSGTSTDFRINAAYGAAAVAAVGTVGAHPMFFFTNNTERMRIASTGAIGLSGANYGTSGQVLTSAGSGAAPTWTTVGGGSVAGSNTQVQYNNAGAFGASANLTFDGTTLTAAGLAGPHNGTVGATTPAAGTFTTVTASGNALLSGYTALTYVTNTGATSASTNIGLLAQNSSVFNYSGTGTPSSLYGIVSAPQTSVVTGSGTTGLSGGFLANPSITSSEAGAATALRGIVCIVRRAYAADLANTVNNTIRGVDVAFGHESTLASTANTNNALGVNISAQLSAGTMNNIYASFISQMLANPTTGAVSAGNMSGIYLNTNSVGTGSGTATIGSYYGFRHVGLTNGANGTITTAHELSLGGISNSGTITNKFAIHQADTTSTNYFGSRLLLGTTTNNASGGILQLSSGITFPATQVASSDANTLDDYEEGTWTPTVNGYNSAPTITYTSQTGTYTKVGRQVTVSFKIVVATSIGGSGEILVAGLPFTSGGEYVASMLTSGIDFGTSATQLTGRTESAAWIRLYGMFNNGALVSAPVSAVAAGDTIQGTLTYFV